MRVWALIFTGVILYWISLKAAAQCYLPLIEYNKWGILDDSLKEVVPPKYDYLKCYDEHFWIYQNGLRYGVLNRDFQEITPPLYEVIYRIDQRKLVALEGQRYVVQYWQDSVPEVLEVDTLYQAFEHFLLVGKEQKQGIMNYQKEWKIPPVYDEIKTNGEDIIVLEEGRYFFVDTLNRKRFHKGFEEAYFFSEHMALVRDDELYGFLNEQGEWITNKEFLNAQSFQEGLAPVEKNNRWGYINAHNQLVIPYVYDWAFPFQKGRAIVQFKGKWGVISPKGKILVPLQYDEIQYFEDSLFLVRNKQFWGLLKPYSEWVLKPQFSDFKKFHCKYWIFYLENKSSLIIDNQGNIVWKNL